jgi:hypothetical protein
MIIFIDIDETICNTGCADYSKAMPNYVNIEKANNLYKRGNHIVYYTSRGSQTGIDWKDLTEQQLIDWDVLYHELRLDKPFYDLLIDDKALNAQDWI